jgi:arylsulfatase A-like enzyme
MGCYGNRFIRTPHLDKLAEAGVLFEDAHCTHPLCMPSRATLLTGRYIHSHGLYRNGIPLDRRETLISEVLAGAGYRTGLIGKAHFTPYKGDPQAHPESVQTNNGVSEEECWDYWRKFDGPYYGFEHVRLAMGHGDYGMMGGHYGLWVHEEHGEQVPLFSQQAALEPSDPAYPSWKSAVPLEIHSSTWITDKTIEFMRESADEGRPFYAWVGYQEPHVPFNPPQPYCDMYSLEDVPLPVFRDGEWGETPPEHVAFYLDREKWGSVPERKVREMISHYYGSISLMDDCVGRLIEYLKEAGLYDRTVIVFTSDHGEWLGDHGLWLKGAVHTRGLTRIPLIVRWPGAGRSGLKVSEVASLVDLMPTLLDAAGVEIPYGVQGKSMRGVLQGQSDGARGYALIEHRHEPYSINRRFEGERGIVNRSEQDFYIKTIITDRYRLSHIPGSEYGELFDLQEDPDELYNLWQVQPELRRQLQLKLLDVLIETEDPLPQRIWAV